MTNSDVFVDNAHDLSIVECKILIKISIISEKFR